jgi:hypothetical protein
MPAGAAAANGEPGEAATSEAATAGEGGPQRQVLRLRNWRRRHRRARPVPRLGSAEAGDATPAGNEGAEQAATTGGEAATTGETPPGDSARIRPRRRRRRPRPAISGHTPGETGDATAGEAAPAEAAGEAPTRPLGTRPPRSRNRRRRRPAVASAENGAVAPAEHPPERSVGRRDRDQRSREQRPDGARGDDRRDRGQRSGPGRGDQRGDRRGDQRNRGRGGPPGRGLHDRKIERKLYSFDSVVDRGFEDVEEEAGTRRVHWTILKRTTADQISRKPISAVYVLQRDGNDSEFPNLGAARSAVNKTIVHPEKLTRSKEEYAAEKNAKR